MGLTLSNMLASAQVKSVPHHHEDRQWDARFNVQTEEDLTQLVDAIRADYMGGKLKYILIGGTEVGPGHSNPTTSSAMSTFACFS